MSIVRAVQSFKQQALDAEAEVAELKAENAKLREAAKVAVNDYNRWVINEYGAVDGLDELAELLEDK